MIAINKLIASSVNKKIGNHRVVHKNDSVFFYYHQTAIVIINYLDKTIVLDNGGWGTSSTTRAINAYLRSDLIKKLLSSYNYTIIDLR